MSQRSDQGVAASPKEWRWIADAPDYMVSNHGDARHRRVGAPFLKGDTDSKGCRRVGINGKHRRVARLVCEAFHGPCPSGFECGHLDGNKHNDSAENLRWITRSENSRHCIAHGTFNNFGGNARGRKDFGALGYAGERNPAAKLTEQQVREIRAKASNGMSRRALGREYGISAAQAHRIIKMEYWANV